MSLDRIEKLGRLVLWFAISSACVVVPLEYFKSAAVDAERKEAAKAFEEKEAAKLVEREAAAKADKTRRLTLGSMGEYLTSLVGSQGHVVFSNVSARSGYVCITGIARNRTTQKTTTSLASCTEVAPYASDVSVSLLFAGSDIGELCPNASCELLAKEAPEGPEVAVAEAPAPRGATAPAPTAQ